MVCSHFGEQSNAQYLLHGVQQESGGVLPSKPLRERAARSSFTSKPEGSHQLVSVTYGPGRHRVPIPISVLLAGNVSELLIVSPKKLFSNLQPVKAGRFAKSSWEQSSPSCLAARDMHRFPQRDAVTSAYQSIIY